MHVQEKGEAVKKLAAAAKAAESRLCEERSAAVAQPLECSQRAVIRDLSAKLTVLSRDNAHLRGEHDRALVKLLLPHGCSLNAQQICLHGSVLQ
jgi:hypothetical protein